MKSTLFIGSCLVVVALLLINTHRLKSKANRINYIVEKELINLREDKIMRQKKLNTILTSERLEMNLAAEMNNNLILVLPDEICYTCYYDVMDSLRRVLDNYSFRPIIIGNFDSEYILKHNIGQLKFDGYSCYNVRNRNKLPVDKLNLPYLFFYKDGICEHFYLMEKNNSESLSLYIDLIKRLYN